MQDSAPKSAEETLVFEQKFPRRAFAAVIVAAAGIAIYTVLHNQEPEAESIDTLKSRQSLLFALGGELQKNGLWLYSLSGEMHYVLYTKNGEVRADDSKRLGVVSVGFSDSTPTFSLSSDTLQIAPTSYENFREQMQQFAMQPDIANHVSGAREAGMQKGLDEISLFVGRLYSLAMDPATGGVFELDDSGNQVSNIPLYTITSSWSVGEKGELRYKYTMSKGEEVMADALSSQDAVKRIGTAEAQRKKEMREYKSPSTL